MDIKSLNKKICEPKVSRLLPNVCEFQKENHTQRYGFKNLKKIYSLVYGYVFFVISISVWYLTVLCDAHMVCYADKTE
jgi:hypothetical protein